MKKISIIGDSFSADLSDGSWVQKLAKDFTIDNYSQRGISQYRLYKNLEKNLNTIKKADAIIIFHTNPDRIYIPDGVNFPSRMLNSHPYCDLVASDSLEKKSWNLIVKNYYRYFYDQDQQNLFYHMLIGRINDCLPESTVIHCSGFNVSPAIKDFSQIQKIYPGNINHCSELGNDKIYQFIIEKLNDSNV